MKAPATESKLALVGTSGTIPAFPRQAGETQDRWSWVERSVWTERMLRRLTQSQEQTVWYSLWDKVWQPANLDQAILERTEYPIQWFAGQGLFSLKQAQAQWFQSLTGPH